MRSAAHCSAGSAISSRAARSELRQKLDPRASNGAVLLGLNGIVIKSHGGTDAVGFANAVEVGYSMARNGLLGRLNRT